MIEIIALAIVLLPNGKIDTFVEQPPPKPVTIVAIAQPIEPVAEIKPLAALPKPQPRPVQAQVPKTAPRPPAAPNTAPKTVAQATSLNTYSAGYCTWYVKNKRPSIPNGWGNAVSWYGNAQAQGYATGLTPRVGAVAWQGGGYGHVALVTGVGSGTVTITEMNFKGRYIVSSRTVPSTTFKYIY